MRNEKKKSRIPLCRSDFLQDVTIALGRLSLKRIRKWTLALTFEVSEECLEGASLERLDVEMRRFGGGLTKIVVWENAESWMYSREKKTTTPDSPAIETRADLAAMSPDGIADLIRATLSDPLQAQGEWKKADTYASAMKLKKVSA